MISFPYKNTATLIIAEATFLCVRQAFGQYSTVCIVSVTPAALDVMGFLDKQDTEAFLPVNRHFFEGGGECWHTGSHPKINTQRLEPQVL